MSLPTRRELIAEAAAFLNEADAAVAIHPDVKYAGFLHDAKKEFAEANLTLAFVSDKPTPAAAELRVEVQAYLNGMAEAASELRRQVLDCLRRGELADAERQLGVMDDVYGMLVTIDYPDALTRGLRRDNRRAARRARTHARRCHHGARRGAACNVRSSRRVATRPTDREMAGGTLQLPSGV